MVVMSIVLLLAGEPPVIEVTPVPLVRAGPAQGEVVMEYDQAWANKGVKPMAPLIQGVADRFDMILADYPSARFREVTLGYRELKMVMCGYYNAKNQMGAYVGWAPFYAISDGQSVNLRTYGPDEDVPYSYRYHCEGPTAWIPGDYAKTVTFK